MLIAVPPDVLGQIESGRAERVVGALENSLSIDGAPEALDEHDIPPSRFAVPGKLDPSLRDRLLDDFHDVIGPQRGSELVRKQ